MAWTDKYLELGGAGTGDGSVGDPWTTFAEALSEIGAISAPTRVYVKGNETLAANIAWNVAGANATPLIFVGCDASWNVIGNDASATKPTVTCGAYTFDVSGAYITVDNLAFTSSHTTAGGTLDNSGALCTYKRCRFTATGSNANSVAFRTTASATVIGCWFSASTTASFCVNFSDSSANVLGCELIGGVSGINAGGGATVIQHSIIRNIGTGSGVTCSANAIRGSISNNTIIGHSNATSGIVLTGTTPLILVANNLICNFAKAGTYPIHVSNATSSSTCLIAFNAWYNCANDVIGGVIETQATHGGESLDFCNNIWNYGNTAPFDSDPLPNAASLGDAADFDLASTHKALAFPGIFEAGEYAYQGYLDHGALQRLEDYPTAANARYGVTFGGLGATAGSKALTGAIEMPNSDSPTGTQDATSDACVVSGKKYGSPQSTGSAAGGGGGTTYFVI